MRKLAVLFALIWVGGCGANYSQDSNLADPQSAPLAGVCAPCTQDSDCGPGAYCAAEGNDPPEFCTAPCDANGQCPAGQSCDDFGNGLSGCYPSSNTCKTAVVGPTAGNGAGGDVGSTGDTSDPTTTGSPGAGSTTGGDTAGTTEGGSTAGSTTGTTSTPGSSSSGTTGSRGSSSSSTGTTGTHGSSSGSTGGTTGNSCTPDTWATTMHAFFNNNCNRCHSFTSVSAVRSEASSIKSRISSGSMPQGASLSTAQKNAVINWINCGEP